IDVKSVDFISLLNNCYQISIICRDAQNHPLVMRFTPPLTLLTHSRLPICASVKDVASTSKQKVVDVKPIDPYIDAKEEHVYASFDSYRECSISLFTHIHLIQRI